MGDQPEGMTAPPPPPPADPRVKVQGPAIFMIVAAAIGAAFCLLSLFLNIFSTGLVAMVSESGEEQAFNLFTGVTGIFINIVELGVAGFIVYGALQMKDLKNHAMAMVAAIISMIPCVSPCCLIGLPAGIWALIVLSKPEVKAAFAKK